MWLLASLQRKATNGATLSGCQKSKPSSPAPASFSPYAPSVIRVRAAGQMALTVMPCFQFSCATIWAKAAMPALAAP